MHRQAEPCRKPAALEGHTQTEVSLTPSFLSQCNLLFMAFQPVFGPGDGVFSPQQSEKIVSVQFLSAVLKSKHLPSPESIAL